MRGAHPSRRVFAWFHLCGTSRPRHASRPQSGRPLGAPSAGEGQRLASCERYDGCRMIYDGSGEAFCGISMDVRYTLRGRYERRSSSWSSPLAAAWRVAAVRRAWPWPCGPSTRAGVRSPRPLLR